MDEFFRKIKIIWGDTALRSRILFVVIILLVFRLLAALPIPGVDPVGLQAFLSNNEFFGLFSVFSGGGLTNLSIMMLGVGPYITASIIMQLGTIIFPRVKEMYHEEGETGRRKVAMYSRVISVPLAIIQSFSFIALLQSQGIITALSPITLVTNIAIITAGSVLLMWIGELISEFGVGNGVSFIIFAGIVSSLPGAATQLFAVYDPAQLPTYIGLLIATLAVVFGIVFVNEAERPIPIAYAKQNKGSASYGGVSTYIPLRVAQAGVIPIIFAISILLLPQMIVNFLINVANPTVQTVVAAVNTFLATQWLYALVYFVLVFAFTYFYTAITFDPDQMAENLQKGGAFIPGVRPGEATAVYVSNIMTRLTLIGALFLGIVAVLPLLLRMASGIASLSIGGTALLIVVSVVIDLVKKVDAQAAMREY
ncbi:MAG: preprotein translocase subunit SecY [Candidatus Zambryskibacteria bacterium CG10_big_fil_rev_8_21_14_0_10_42_12]|uniref:Protein translocase subunit SecY n=1 Tax=Candidatus Zambryskibacteria bacterium CG10_big_fil_rev_8_21_14_0_10_42_12 TaxID=1975115 RepID=A0A2H0QWF4_9BACT|nr:MAG: preprotein translocase subunit SecY [Candidatus Zambryskibacteria bacterium CG10_big_fil_rev_8_21_14_0_10_42_12]